MPIDDRKFKRLTTANVERAPKRPGVYALYGDRRTVVFLGRTVGEGTLRSALRAHVGLSPAGATRYKREASTAPDARWKALLAEHVAAHGRPPSGNAPAK
jgi:hypothetical protein